MTPLSTTHALAEATRASIAAAVAAYQRGAIAQRETSAGSGVWQLVRGES